MTQTATNWVERYEQLQAENERLRKVVEAFERYDVLLKAWGRRLDDGNQHVGDDPELDDAYAAILVALGAADG